MKNLIKSLIKWASENPRSAAVVIFAIMAGGKEVNKLTKSVNRVVAAKQEQYNRDRYVYDHSLGIYLKTKHRLTKKDLEMIDRLRRRGFSKSQAMIKLNLIEDGWNIYF